MSAKSSTLQHPENSQAAVLCAPAAAIDLGDVWSHYCTINEEGEVVDRGRFRTSPKGVEKWFTGGDGGWDTLDLDQ
jgi:hypothetical protein